MVPATEAGSRSARRGRTPARSRHEIAGAAVGIADRDGLGAVTMRSVAQSLGTGAASLYRYVSTRDELLALMVDEVGGELDLHGQDGRPWLEQMLDLAGDVRSLYRRHPWMLEVSGAALAPGPNGIAYLEQALSILARTPVDGGTRLEAVAVFDGLVRILCRQEHETRRTDETPAAPRALSDQLSAVASSTGSYPHLAAALADSGPPDDPFDRVLRRVLTGLLDARASASPRRSRTRSSSTSTPGSGT